MDEALSKKIIKNTFENKFDKSRFTNFIVELLNLSAQEVKETSVTYNINYIPNIYQPFINSFEKITSYEPDGAKLDVLVIRLNKETSIERARTMQRNFIAWYLRGGCDGEQKDAALAAFVSLEENDWRFSLIKMDFSVIEDKRGTAKVIEQFSPAKRWSFLVGSNEKSHTAQSQLIDIVLRDDKNITIAQLEEAFNVEKVTKEFFNKYRELFFKTKEALDEIISKDSTIKLDFEKKNINTSDFAKKLLGQIVFLYFLQKKGWFGVARDKDWGTGPKNFLRELQKSKHGDYKNFFNDILEPLFYEALRIDRSANDDYYDKFNCKIPFLNGGLFDPIGEYDWVHTDIKLPNYLFSNFDKTREGVTGTGILDIFDRYNFTVKEDEPLEKEVAVDPEMLGKVFENLLEVKDRKSKGTYYTPREIVHYMCQQSIINYLSTEFEEKIPEGDIEKLINYGGQFGENDVVVQTLLEHIPDNIIAHAKTIDCKLLDVKVCDPAVGSGAFLVGMMNEIVRIRNALSGFIKDSNRTIYNFKRDCIENSLYGVDVDPGAVEICKLRLWLSLIVDEEDIKQIKPLPNLDYKIICGDSLFGVEVNLFNQQAFGQLEDLKPLYFKETDIKKKQILKHDIIKFIEEITNGHKEFDFNVYFSEVFTEKGGFDIVMANPPYIGEKSHKDIFRKIRNGPLGMFYNGKMDIFYFFIHLALNIGHPDSQITFITTNYYLTASGGRKLREDIHNRAIIRRLINFNELRIFESALGQHNMITCLSKKQNKNHNAKNSITIRTGIATQSILENILRFQDNQTTYYNIIQKDLYDGNEYYIRVIGNPSVSCDPIQSILKKVKTIGVPLSNICNINSGIQTGCDRINDKGVFVLTKEELCNIPLNEHSILKPFFKNSDIQKYKANKESKYFVIYTDRNFPLIKSRYPSVISHLLNYRSRLSQIREVKNGIIKFYQLQWPRDEFIFTSEKIICPQRSKNNVFAYSEKDWHASVDVYFITKKYESISLKYVLALLNSKLYYLWLYHRGKRKGETLELYQKPLSEIPIKKINIDEQELFIGVVNSILAITEGKDYLTNSQKQLTVKKYEDQIDQLIYKLYELTPEEIEIVENSCKK